MHDINKIRENKDLFLSGWKKRGLEIDIDKILNIDRDLRKSITSLQELQTKRNDISKLIGKAKKEGDNIKADELSKKVQEFKKLILTVKAFNCNGWRFQSTKNSPKLI